LFMSCTEMSDYALVSVLQTQEIRHPGNWQTINLAISYNADTKHTFIK
jgi:hypothetical protein